MCKKSAMGLRFLKQPFIPEKQVKLMLIDGSTPYPILEKLSSLGISLILTEKCTSVQESISYHPDIQLHPLGSNKIAVCPESFKTFSKKLLPYGFKIICGTNPLRSNYPDDIAYNVARIGKICFHNFKYTAPIIRSYFEDNRLVMLNVKQGYSKCSIAILNKSAIITSDKGIHETAFKYGIDSLLISPGNITLKDQSYGFIGGCTGLLSPDILAVTGSLENHPDCKKIINHAKKYSIEILPLSKDIPIDVGSLIPLMEESI
ncbi:MAG: DUF6873 family GME fold protein [Deltaproteobacteria bacterium]